MKVVINVCFGGFSLSGIGEKRYLGLIGKEQFLYKQTKYDFRDGVTEYEKTSAEGGDGMFNFTSLRDLGAKVDKWPDKEDYFYNRDIPRDDPNLVKVVEELGNVASGSCAELRVVEIPDGADWEIDDYDGREHIAECHRTWS